MNISEVTANQNNVAQKQAILAAIVSSSDEAIISTSLDGIITSWNDAAKNLFGFTEAEVLEKNISLIIPNEHLKEAGLASRKVETIRITKKGKPLNISLKIAPIKNKNGQTIGISMVAKDRSQEIKAEKRYELHVQKLQKLNDYKDQLIIMASHELKTPLTVISANQQILELAMQEDPNLRLISSTIKQVKKLSGIINNLLQLSLIQKGKLECNPSTFDMNVLIAEISDNLQLTTTHHQIIFNKYNGPLMVYADKEKIEQVLANIVGNAIKYSPDGGEIIIGSFLDKDHITVTTRDHGIGIAAEHLEDIFSRFYRVSGLGSAFPGTGIGLFIASEFIKKHDGDIWAESIAGKGSVFCFSIPAKVNPSPARPLQNREDPNKSLNKLTY